MACTLLKQKIFQYYQFLGFMDDDSALSREGGVRFRDVVARWWLAVVEGEEPCLLQFGNAKCGWGVDGVQHCLEVFRRKLSGTAQPAELGERFLRLQADLLHGFQAQARHRREGRAMGVSVASSLSCRQMSAAF